MQKTLAYCAGILLLVSVPSVSAEACTYNEAQLALQNGNQVRGFSLMKMAAIDGDQRAVLYLAKLDVQRIGKQESTEFIVANATPGS